jgi:hypothetical protein
MRPRYTVFFIQFLLPYPKVVAMIVVDRLVAGFFCHLDVSIEHFMIAKE